MRTVLRQLWRLPAPADPRPASRYDVAFVVVVAVLAGLEATLWRPGLEGRWIGLVAFSVWLPTLVVRRTRPRLPVEVFAAINLVLVLAATTNGPALPDDLHTGVVALLIPYSLARWAGGRDAIIGLGLFFLVVTASLTDPAVPPADRIGAVAICLTATSVGAVVRARSMLRTHQLDDVRRAERERLARDLHDTVAHHLTAIAITAQAGLAVADLQPTAARDALKRIDEEATRTLAETRKVLHVLRTEAPEEVPERPLDDLAGLAAPAGPGPAVEVALADDLDLSPTLAAAVHRIAREAVANARRHAVDATTVRVDVRRRLDLVELTVTDDGQDPRHPREGAGAGFGVVGMTERAELLGGRLSAGPAAGGGWRVSALLPAEPR